MLSTHITNQISTTANYFGDLIYQLLCEYSMQLDAHYPYSHFLSAYNKHQFKVNLDLSISKLICHAYPILYDLQLQHENDNAKLLNYFLNDIIQTHREEQTVKDIYYAILNFKAMASAKQAQHQLKSTITPTGIRANVNGHPLRLISLHITPACQALSLSLEKTQQFYLQHNKNRPCFHFNTMINRVNGFMNFANKQSVPNDT